MSQKLAYCHGNVQYLYKIVQKVTDSYRTNGKYIVSVLISQTGDIVKTLLPYGDVVQYKVNTLLALFKEKILLCISRSRAGCRWYLKYFMTHNRKSILGCYKYYIALEKLL